MAPLFGLHMPNFTYPDLPPERLFDRVVETAQAAEAAGFDCSPSWTTSTRSHVVGPETEPMLEAYSTLAALAQATSRVRLGTLVTGVTYRNPAMLAKMVTTLDTISKGRAILGIGAAWNDSEHAGYGFEFPPVRERMDRLGEALTIAKLMFTEERPTLRGATTRSTARSTSPARSRPAARRSWLAAAASSGPCGWPPATPT